MAEELVTRLLHRGSAAFHSPTAGAAVGNGPSRGPPITQAAGPAAAGATWRGGVRCGKADQQWPCKAKCQGWRATKARPVPRRSVKQQRAWKGPLQYPRLGQTRRRPPRRRVAAAWTVEARDTQPDLCSGFAHPHVRRSRLGCQRQAAVRLTNPPTHRGVLPTTNPARRHARYLGEGPARCDGWSSSAAK